jgi:hypothetical protein
VSDPAREQRQRAGLGRLREPRAAEGVGEAVAEVEVGDEVVAIPEALSGEVLVESGERAGRFVELDQRRRPRVIR